MHGRRFLLWGGLLGLALAGGCQRPATRTVIRIGVAQFVTHPALDDTQRGFEKALADAGFQEGPQVEYVRYNAQGDFAMAYPIAQSLRNEGLDLVHTLATPMSQAVVKMIRDVPVVFAAVTDPVSAGIVPPASKVGMATGTNVTGVSDRWPVRRQFQTYVRIAPQARIWGTIYNPADANSLVHLAEMRQAAGELGVELIEATIATSAETLSAAQYLGTRVEAMLLTSDNTAASSLESVVKVCNERKIPFFTGDLESLSRGSVAAFGPEYFQIGYESGLKAVRILRGEKPGDIPWGLVEKFRLGLNVQAARLQGVVLTDELRREASVILGE